MVFFRIDPILQRLFVLDVCQVAKGGRHGGGFAVVFFFADFCPDAAVVG